MTLVAVGLAPAAADRVVLRLGPVDESACASFRLPQKCLEGMACGKRQGVREIDQVVWKVRQNESRVSDNAP